MNSKDKLICWLIGFSVLVGFLILVKGILLPFVVALIAAYFLDPAADRIEDLGLSRTFATIAITGSFFAVVALIAIMLVPVMYDQLVELITKAPEYAKLINQKIIPAFAHLFEQIDPTALEKAKEAVSNVSGHIFSFAGKIVQNIWSSGVAVINLFSLIFITPVVTFYILRDWDKIIAKVNSWLPPRHKPVITNQIKQIDRTLSGYIRGQTNVCLLLGTFYAVGLTLAGLDFGLFIGMATGILSFIPYVGMLFGFMVGVAVAFFQFGDFLHIALIAGVFILGNVLEGTFVAPTLVGDKVGLHPVWIIFGMLAGAAMFGFTGILLAIPVTAIIGVLTKFALEQYLKSSLYMDKSSKVKKKTA